MIKKVSFGVKSYIFFRKRECFPLKVVNHRKTLKKGLFMRFYRKLNTFSQNMDKSIKTGNLCNFREKKYCRDKEYIFLVFFQQMKI